jgi:hypothetical protein
VDSSPGQGKGAPWPETMVDPRPPIEVPVGSGVSIKIQLHWVGKSGPILTGDESQTNIEVENLSATTPVSGSLALTMGLPSPGTGWFANPHRVVTFRVAPGEKRNFDVPNEWLYVEGKAVYLLDSVTITGLQPNSVINRGDPLMSFTIFERSSYLQQQNQSRTTMYLALAAVLAAAASAAIAAYVALHPS